MVNRSVSEKETLGVIAIGAISGGISLITVGNLLVGLILVAVGVGLFFMRGVFKTSGRWDDTATSSPIMDTPGGGDAHGNEHDG